MSEPTSSVTVHGPAKVNLHLAVGPTRPDGFHELVTVFQAVSVHDVVTAVPAARGDGLRLRVHGDGGAPVPDGPDNLAWRAAESLAADLGRSPDVTLTIDKRIPVAGGMAGGSADAAAALVACARLWAPRRPAADLHHLAAGLGSDVAFGLVGATALGTGRGERLTPVPAPAVLHWVFAASYTGISTPAAYRELDRLRATGAAPDATGSADAMLAALAAGDVAAVKAALGNDLQAAALSLQPSLVDLLAAGERAGALRGLVSGSGPTCAFLCEDAAAADRVADALRGSGLCRDALVATGPAPGAAG